VRSLYRFHAYYHIRRILKRMLVLTPSEEGFDRYNNPYNLKEVRRIGDEYGCSTKSLYLYRNSAYFDRTGGPGRYVYEHNNWSRWIMNSSHGFTKYGLEKISESIRAYTFLVLTSQAGAWNTRRNSPRIGCSASVLRQLGRRHQQVGFSARQHSEVPERAKVR